MAKRRSVLNEEKIAAWIKEGRGSGEGKNYYPWVTIHDIPSRGRSSRINGWKSGRNHHLLSDGETRIFYLLEWSDSVIDIREQFPLLDREHAQRIAEKNSIKYPTYPDKQTPYVLTTDFMITVLSNGKKTYLARTFKYPEELVDNEKNNLIIEKFEIERIYWEERGINWGIIQETDESKVLAKNVEWVHGYYWKDDLPVSNHTLLNDLLDNYNSPS